MNDLLFTDVKAAEIMGLRPQTLRNWRFLSKGPPYLRLGRRILYQLSDIQDFCLRHRIDPEKGK